MLLRAICIAVCFSYGIFSVRNQWPPYPIFERASEAYYAQQLKEKEIADYMNNTSLVKKRKQKYVLKSAHLKYSEPDKIFPGAVVMSAGSHAAMLVDTDGRIMHTWNLPFSKVWKNPDHVSDPNPDDMIRFIDIELFPNGDLLAIYHADNDTPYGYGMVKMNAKNKIIWKLPLNVHHDMYVAKNDNIYTLTHAYEDKEGVYPIAHFESPILADKITILNAHGKQIDEIPLIDAFIDTPYQSMLYNKVGGSDAEKHDYTHANSVMRLEEDIAERFPMFQAGFLLVSLRNIHAIAVIDPQTKKVVWASRSIWKLQHEAQFLPNGNILLFDNHGYMSKGDKRSRILEINPENGAVEWFFAGTKNVSFYTDSHGSQQRLPNGNTLIVESQGGNKVTEVTPQKRVIWNYSVRKEAQNQIINKLNKAYKVPYNFFTDKFCKKIKCPKPENEKANEKANEKPAKKTSKAAPKK